MDMNEIKEATRVELMKHIEQHGHRYSRCDVPQLHSGHVWAMDPYPAVDWWCDGLLAKLTTPLTLAEFESAHGRRYRKCSRLDPHIEHNWEIPGLGALWCADEKPEAWATGLPDGGDMTIRPLPCPVHPKLPHPSHLWDDGDAHWSCPGVDIEPKGDGGNSIRIAAYHKRDGNDYSAQIGAYTTALERALVEKFDDLDIPSNLLPVVSIDPATDDGSVFIPRISGFQQRAREDAENAIQWSDWQTGAKEFDWQNWTVEEAADAGNLLHQRLEFEWMNGKPEGGWSSPDYQDAIHGGKPNGDIPLGGQHNRESLDPETTVMDVNQQEDKPGTEIAKWADKAMFTAEPIDAQEGPRVYLLWMTPDPLGAIAAACKMYKGEVVRDLRTVTDEERLEYLAQVQKTKLKAPFEFVKFHFLIEGVTRAFTHQQVRQRTAVYAQESLRFAVKEDMPVGLPPSLQGLPDDDSAVKLWHQAIDDMGESYRHLVDMGVPAEDARGLLPTNILTRIHYSTDLRALLDHAGNRLCTQAQFEWRLVFAQIMDAIRSKAYGNPQTGESSPEYANGSTKVYMANELTAPFKPVCYQTGKCEFKANFDRACSIRERVDANERIGRPSSEWDRPVDLGMPNPVMDPRNPAHEFPWMDRDGRTIIPEIKPGEWLLDSGAAREK